MSQIPARLLSPLILPYRSAAPQLGEPLAFAGDRSAVLGRATLGRGARLGAAAVIRADGHFVQAGDDFFLGPRATVHIVHDLYPAVIGDRVTVGTNAVVHACTLGSDIVVEDDAVILDGSVVEGEVVLEVGSIVFPRSTLSRGKLYGGMPARPIRDLQPGELSKRASAIRDRAGTTAAGDAEPPSPLQNVHESVFIAATARLAGAISAGPNASIWFGCELDSNGGEIFIGDRANIQDNTMIRCRPGERFALGAGSLIGHNVTLGACTIGERSLIGISSVVASGTVVESDVLLAAGAQTREGQVLESGWIWGKRPAQKLAPLDAAKRERIAVTVEQYCGYAQVFLAEQRRLFAVDAGR